MKTGSGTLRPWEISKCSVHTMEMFDRYNVVDREDTRNAVNQLEGYLQFVDQNAK